MSDRLSAILDTEIDYPESDGRPMAETPLHRDLMFLVIEMLRFWFAKNPMAYVSGNMFWYYERGNPRRRVSPDVQVTLGIPKLPERRVYRTWIEGRVPDVVFELTSLSTQREDLETKYELYRRLGVTEYFLFDPEADYLDPSMQGYRFVDGEYEPIAFVDDRLPSEVLGLHLERDDKLLRFRDPKTGKRVPFPAELLAQTDKELRDEILAREQAEEALHAQSAARKQAEAEAERLRREIEVLRRGSPPT